MSAVVATLGQSARTEGVTEEFAYPGDERPAAITARVDDGVRTELENHLPAGTTRRTWVVAVTDDSNGDDRSEPSAARERLDGDLLGAG
jgi:hypothetical protein